MEVDSRVRQEACRVWTRAMPNVLEPRKAEVRLREISVTRLLSNRVASSAAPYSRCLGTKATKNPTVVLLS